MPSEGSKPYVKIALDFMLLAIVGVPLLVFLFIGTPYRRGFFCDDDSIRYPYKDSTISNITLYCVAILGPVIVMTIVEGIICKKCKLSFKEKKYFCGYSISYYVFQLYHTVGVFAFGGCISQLATDIAKYSIGRLRPHFIDVCQPDQSLTECTHEYILNYECTSSDEDKIQEARLSFPSGHASFSAYAMIYLTVYLQYRMVCPKNSLLRPFLQAGALLTSWYIGLTRVMDFMHHWSDVLSGFLIGTVVSLLVVLFIADWKKPPDRNCLPVGTYTTCEVELQLENQAV
ncbi:putative phosphatidate phosphatase [Limulus polyphemus]|uniref:Phosphatidate phosphatase n=1 Tax=Limulus polyphemus TaxID=6850 RepID=A0ABM1BUS9_LIMPO|nr:putative phosphatidate phosphatase [Limulus polyphemus]